MQARKLFCPTPGINCLVILVCIVDIRSIPIDQSPRTQTKWVPEGGSRDDKFNTEMISDDNLYFSVRSVMHKHLTKMGEVTFDKIFGQKLGECAVILNNTEVFNL